MVDEFYKAISTYYDVISQSGYMPIKKTQELIVMSFLYDLLADPDYLFMATECEQGIVNKLYNCLTEKNCLI